MCAYHHQPASHQQDKGTKPPSAARMSRQTARRAGLQRLGGRTHLL
ncbi:hypothetical protein E2C01_081845 [Portunus trituberculatus]|uniref:Uncharacterized protein n=1 Tax=Portunus trituberculatus TaxID=210409 RepID=A0A5B7IZY6_PORTR|nr:hypothetical protein [Portunus trituberculatus]